MARHQTLQFRLSGKASPNVLEPKDVIQMSRVNPIIDPILAKIFITVLNIRHCHAVMHCVRKYMPDAKIALP